MNTQNYKNFTIYNASAGSGKTRNLVKSYLKIILSTEDKEHFRHLLAITFTNKAVFEMKDRLIKELEDFSLTEREREERGLIEANSMFVELCKELSLKPIELRKRADVLLKYILHNYATFHVTTIDSFNHQLIRNFWYELHLNPFFEVQLDSETLLERAVDNLLDLAGKEGEGEELAQLITEFSNEKMQEDKNWDTRQELLQVAKMLSSENHFQPLKALETKTPNDFKRLKKTLTEQRNKAIATIKQAADSFLALVESNDIERLNFDHGWVYDFFKNRSDAPEKEPSGWGAGWQSSLADPSAPLYAEGKRDKIDTDKLDAIKPQVHAYFTAIKQAYAVHSFVKSALKLITPLALLSRIKEQVELIKTEENILPIWEFNGLISDEISRQPIPFIYEHIGERYRHYFIDEFQDTSELQWKNLIPLMKDSVQSMNNDEEGSLLLVGDAKQSIYRFRGGKAEQFIGLYSKEVQPFDVGATSESLDDNYRTLPKVIDFNNDFFKFVANEFRASIYKDLYLNAAQNCPKNKDYTQYKDKDGKLCEGYVQVQFLNLDPKEEQPLDPLIPETFTLREQRYCQAVLEKIEHANRAGAADKDITVLVRKNKEGAAIASYLSANGKEVVSPDSLLLMNVPSVKFLVSLLQLFYHSDSREYKVKMLFDYIRLKGIKDVDSLIRKYLDEPIGVFFEQHNFSLEQFNQYALYEAIAYAIGSFGIAHPSDAYLTHFLDLVFDFKNARKGSLGDFLEYWEEKKEDISISSPEGRNAIRIMTVHKSKGLESPVIIYAFADSKLIENKKEEVLWHPVPSERYDGFDFLLVNSNRSLETYSDTLNYAPEFITQHNEEKLLDEINVLYVAMTRPKHFLYVITALPKAGERSYASLLDSYLSANDYTLENENCYSYGYPYFPVSKKAGAEGAYIHFPQVWTEPVYTIATTASDQWLADKRNAIERGNTVHELMTQIYKLEDVDVVLQSALAQQLITDEDADEIKRLTNNNDLLLPFFKDDNYVQYIERDFIDGFGHYFRPDRIAHNPQSKETYILDYKTGEEYDAHKKQLRRYAACLSKMGWKVKAAYLLYLDRYITEEVSL